MGQLVVLVVVCVAIGVATECALRQYLLEQVDEELARAANRSVDTFGTPPPAPPPWCHDQLPIIGPGPRFLDAPGQPVGVLAMVVDEHGSPQEAGYLDTRGERAALTEVAEHQLRAAATHHRPVTRDLDGLGRYRIVASTTRRGGAVILTGVPMTNVDDPMTRVLLIFAVVTAIAVAAATTAGTVIIRRALAPLTRVARTAGEVVTLPL